MIWDSIAIMTIIDLVIIGLAIFALRIFYLYRQTLKQLKLTLGLLLIILGLSIISTFYFVDFLAMHIFPVFMPMKRAMTIMEDLHLNHQWLASTFGVTSITIGLVYLMRTMFPRVHMLIEEQKKSQKNLKEEIDERNQAEKKLLESEEKFRAITQTAQDAIITIDHNGNIIFWNEAACNMFGYAEIEVIGKQILRLIPQRYKEAHKKGIERITTTSERCVIGKTVTLAGLKKDGSEFPMELSLSEWGEKKGIFFTGILRDISKRKQAEVQREKLILDLQHALSEVKTLQGFLPICSHCKKIRDDHGYWNQIESYIHKHSDAEFSHGICPECAKKYYPDIDIYDDNDEAAQD